MAKIIVILLVIFEASCSDKKIHCLTQKTVPVTFIKDGRSVTVPWRYCDTCIVGKFGLSALPDSIQRRLMGSVLSDSSRATTGSTLIWK